MSYAVVGLFMCMVTEFRSPYKISPQSQSDIFFEVFALPPKAFLHSIEKANSGANWV